MSLTLARMFVIGFGLELGAFIAFCLWPETESVSVPLVGIGAALMAISLGASSK